MPQARLYGLNVRSCWPLPSAADAAFVFSQVDIVETRPEWLAERAVHARIERTGWFRCAESDDGTMFLSWRDLLDASVTPDGARIEVASCAPAAQSALHNYLFAQLLSFSLIRAGLEPLHATTLRTPVGGIALLGDSGAGKSTLAAALLQAGCELVADDLLALSWQRDQPIALAGPPLLKLFPQAARHTLPAANSRALNGFTRKRVYALPAPFHSAAPVPLRAIYVLERGRPGKDEKLVTSTPLTGARAMRALVRHTFNPLATSPSRLQRQLALFARLATTLPVRGLRIRRDLAQLPVVTRALLDEVTGLRQGPTSYTACDATPGPVAARWAAADR